MEKNKTLLMLAMAGILAWGTGCASKEALTGKEQGDTSASSDSSGSGTQFIERDSVGDGRQIQGNLLSKRLIFFEYDKAVVPSDYVTLISAHSDFLVANRDRALVLQGHADERGSDEYNLALAQRRSDAVREVMLSSGVFERQIETVSFGEARPRALGHNETAWRENRRVEIVYTDE